MLLGQRMSVADAGTLTSCEFLLVAASAFSLASALRPPKVLAPDMLGGKSALALGESGRKARKESIDKLVKVRGRIRISCVQCHPMSIFRS